MCVELEEVVGIREIPKIQLKWLGQTQVVYTTKAARLEEWRAKYWRVGKRENTSNITLPKFGSLPVIVHSL